MPEKSLAPEWWSGGVGQVTCMCLVASPVSACNYPPMPRRAGKLSHSSQEIITEQLTFLQHEALPGTSQRHQQHYSWWVTFPSAIPMPCLGHTVHSHLGSSQMQDNMLMLGRRGGADVALAVGSSPSRNACLTHSGLACLRSELLLWIKRLLLSQEPNPSLQSCIFSEITEKVGDILEKLFHTGVAPLPIYLACSCATSTAHKLHTWRSWRWFGMVLPWKRPPLILILPW